MAMDPMTASALIGLGGNIIGGMFGSHSAAKQMANQKSLMAYQQQLQNEAYQHRYQWQVEDLKQAGLNPILSVTGGGLAAPVTNPVSTQGAPVQDSSFGKNMVEAITNGFKLDLENKKLDNEKKQLQINDFIAKSNASKNQAEIDRLNQETQLFAEKTVSEIQERGIRKSMSDLEKKRLEQQIKLDVEIGRATVNMLSSQSYMYSSQGDLNREMMKEVGPRALSYLKAAGFSDAKAKEVEFVISHPQVIADREYAKNHPWVASLGSFLRTIGVTGNGIINAQATTLQAVSKGK